MPSSTSFRLCAISAILVLSSVGGAWAQYSGTGGNPGVGGGRNYGGPSPSFGGGHQPEMPGTYSGDPDPFSPRNSQYGSPAVRRATEPRGGGIHDPFERDPRSGLPGLTPYGRSSDHQDDFGSRGRGFRNPLYRPAFDGSSRYDSNPSAAQIYGGSIRANGPQWQQAQDMLARGRVQEAQSLIDRQLQQDRSLHGLMDAVSIMERAGADAAHYQRYRQQAMEIAREQMRSTTSDPLPWVAVAKFSLEDEDDESFRQAADELAQRFPDDKNSYYFQGIAAARDSDWGRAEAALLRAEKLGVPRENIAVWLKMAIDNQRWVWQYALIVLWVLLAWVGGLAVLYVTGQILCRLTLRGITTNQFAEPSPSQRRLRSFYRGVIFIAGLYYYLSLPVLVVISIAGPLAVCYALLHVPVVSLWLIAVVFVVSVGSLLTALSGIWACFVPLDPRLPGRQLPKNENLKLWQLVQEVAHKVGTRPVDAIWIVPTADIGVFERGSFLKRLLDRGERVLVLGAGVLEGFSQRALRSVLAHEYGHFQQRDTAGGDIALRVNLAMENFAASLVVRGKVRWWHVAVQFLRFYYVLFNRLTFGASRLQEVMADRTAVVAYGPAAFEEGLTHSIRRSLEFEYWASNRLRDMVRGRAPAIAFLQSAERPECAAFDELETALDEVFRRPTTEHDTHPSPRDRFSFASSLGRGDPPDDGRMVWELFHEPARICEIARQSLDEQLRAEAEVAKAVTRAKLHVLEEVIDQTPSCQALEARALVHLDVGNFAAALNDLERSLSRAPHALEARLCRVLAWHASKSYRQAAGELSDLMKSSEKARTADLAFLLGECYQKLGDHEQAKRAYVQSLGLKWLAGTAIALAKSQLVLGENEDAIAALSQVIEKFPKSVEAYVERSAAHGAAGNHAQRLADLRAAAALPVAYPRAHREYARALLSDSLREPEQLKQAVLHARIACASMLNLEESLPVLIDALAAAGQFDEACQQIDKLMSLLSADERSTWLERTKQLHALHERNQFSSPAEAISAVWA